LRFFWGGQKTGLDLRAVRAYDRGMASLAVLINIILAILTFYFYVKAGRRFYRRETPFLAILGVAVVLDILTAFSASFKLTPTTVLAGPHVVPWRSILFLFHISTSTLGMFGYIFVYLVLLTRGKKRPLDGLRKFQYRILLPAWALGEVIALTNAILKFVLKIRIYDYFRF
jgi:hypothetical protein